MSDPSAGRLVYLDGLRGVAVAGVLLFHSWQHLHYLVKPYPLSAVVDVVCNRGSQGVSLFLVLSGFCLSLPAWTRRRAGAAQWFRASDFFARRCLRILPPYYAALAFFALIAALSAHFGWQPAPPASWHGHAPLSRTPGALNLLTHLLLIHNLTRYQLSINDAFWSLGLEWQWYWAFPFVLLLCRRSWVGTLALLFGLAALWHVGTHDLWDKGALPLRLFEFACGVAAAHMVVSRRLPRRSWLLAGFFVPLAASVAPLPGPLVHARDVLERTPPFYGIAFTSLLLLAAHGGRLNRVLSWRPLTALGIASYSVYLVHQPIVEAAELYLPLPGALRHSPLLMPAAIACGIAAGVLFHLLVERPCLRHTARARPRLTRLFAWTDTAWARVSLAPTMAASEPDRAHLDEIKA